MTNGAEDIVAFASTFDRFLSDREGKGVDVVRVGVLSGRRSGGLLWPGRGSWSSDAHQRLIFLAPVQGRVRAHVAPPNITLQSGASFEPITVTSLTPKQLPSLLI